MGKKEQDKKKAIKKQEEDIKKAIKANPNDPGKIVELGVHYSRDDKDKALSTFVNAIQKFDALFAQKHKFEKK